MAEEVFIGVDNQRLIVEGSELAELKAKQQTRNELAEAAIQDRLSARESAFSKLAALGLTEEEIAAL
jgi:DNA-binding NarL/FixJ family response regulator